MLEHSLLMHLVMFERGLYVQGHCVTDAMGTKE